MENTQEKSADIIAEMRDLGKLDEKSVDKIPRALMGLGLRTYADRLEAAIKREKAAIEADALAAGGIVEAERYKPGNAAAMREALAALIAYWDWNGFDALRESQLKDMARAALASPPRNCDIHTDFNDAITTLANKRNWHDGKWNSERYCIFASWLLALATNKEGGAK